MIILLGDISCNNLYNNTEEIFLLQISVNVTLKSMSGVNLVSLKDGNGYITKRFNVQSAILSNAYKLASELIHKQKNQQEIKEFITEAYSRILEKDFSKVAITGPAEIFEIAKKALLEGDENAKRAVIEAFALAYALDTDDKEEQVNRVQYARQILENIFDTIKLENVGATTTGQYIPYLLLSAPILRFMMPQMISAEILTTFPMKSPASVLYFLRYRQGNDTRSYPFSAYLTETAAGGKLRPVSSLNNYGTFGGTVNIVASPITDNTAVHTANIIDTLRTAGLIPATGEFELQMGSVRIVSVKVDRTVGGPVVIPVNAVPSETGVFYGSGSVGSDSVTVSGRVNYRTGEITIQIAASVANFSAIAEVNVEARVSYEQRVPARDVKLRFERFDIKEERVDETVIATPEFLYDAKVLFDVDIQAEIVSIISTLLALNTDAFILARLYNESVDANSPVVEVDTDPAVVRSFILGPKGYYEAHLVPAIFELEARLRYNTPGFETKPYLIMNTVDAALLKSVDKYSAQTENYNTRIYLSRRVNGTLSNAMDVIATPLLPSGHNLMVLKSENPMLAIGVYAPYVTLFVPYPATAAGPAMTGIHRFGVLVPLPQSIGRLRLLNRPAIEIPNY